MESTRIRLGVDTGGTFTDAVIMNENSGEFTIDKVPSTPSDPSISFQQIITQSLGAVGAHAAEVTYLVHGTTVATNSIIEGTTARCGLLITEGFRDILEIARQIKPEPFNIFFEKPKPLIPRKSLAALAACTPTAKSIPRRSKISSAPFRNTWPMSNAACLSTNSDLVRT